LVRRYASLSVVAEDLESKLVRGEAVDTAALATITSTLLRLCGRLGIGREANPSRIASLSEYLDGRKADGS
jgi:hypothetical protein